MKKIFIFASLFLIMTFFYTILFPVKLYKRDSYFVKKFISLEKVSEDKKIDGYFFSDIECGYFSFDKGVINHIKPTENKFIQCNSFGYIFYDKFVYTYHLVNGNVVIDYGTIYFYLSSMDYNGDKINLFSQNGALLKEIPTYGYPYIAGDFPIFYVLKTNGTGFSSYSIRGDELIKNIDYTSIITSITTDKTGNSLVSNLDGKTFLYSPTGEVLFSTDSDSLESKIIFTKSSTIDPDGQNIAICSGIESEYIEIYNKKTGFKTFQFKTDTNFRYKTFMEFNKDRLYFEGEDQLKYVNLKNKKINKIKLNGEIKEVQFDSLGKILILTYKNNVYHISLYTPTGIKYFYKESKDKIDNLRILKDDIFYFKLDNKIVKIETGKSS